MTYSRTISYLALGVALILLIPLALQLTIGTGVDGQGFNWELGDFVVAGALLFSFGLAIVHVARRITDRTHRVFVVVALILLLLLVWADLAVGIFNIPGVSGS